MRLPQPMHAPGLSVLLSVGLVWTELTCTAASKPRHFGQRLRSWTWRSRHALVQKLHVFASSRKDMRKSSKDSPNCCFLRLRFHLSTVSLMRPSTCCFKAAIISAWSCFWASVLH